MFGGTNDIKRLADFWKFNVVDNTWVQIKLELNPVARNGHSMITHNNCIVLFGGIRELTHERNDVWVYNTSTEKWNHFEKASSVRNLKKKKARTTLQMSPSPVNEQPMDFMDEDEVVDSPPKPKLDPKMSKNSSQRKFHASSKSQYQELMKEKTEKMQIMKKHLMLKELEVKPEDVDSFRNLSPTTTSMKNSILALGYQSQLQDEPEIGQKKTAWKKRFRIEGQKPQARDGHTALAFKDKMIIFGGDRHKMSFHDLFAFQLTSVH